MPSEGSVTHLIRQLKGRERDAVQQLWEGYFRRLVGLARKQLNGRLRSRAADEEDVALSAFDSLCRGAEEGRFPQLFDRDDLWQLLVLLTTRKAADLVQHERRQKRGGGQVRNEADLPDPGAGGPPFERVIAREPTPAFALQVVEECERLLAGLPDPEARSVALWKVEGFTNDEIAAKLGRSRPTVERKLRLIRACWEEELRHG
jgi:DNA-directed RNA polymerase specialized sigma24 family protein